MPLSVEISRLSLAKWSQAPPLQLTPQRGIVFRKLFESFSPSLAEDQDNELSLQCPLKWADGCEVQCCDRGITSVMWSLFPHLDC